MLATDRVWSLNSALFAHSSSRGHRTGWGESAAQVRCSWCWKPPSLVPRGGVSPCRGSCPHSGSSPSLAAQQHGGGTPRVPQGREGARPADLACREVRPGSRAPQTLRRLLHRRCLCHPEDGEAEEWEPAVRPPLLAG